MKKISLIIVNWNNKKDTLECLDSVYKMSHPEMEMEVIVVDNGSSDDSVSVIRNRFPQSIVIENKDNRGFAGGNNIGIDSALKNNADYVMILNNDTLVEKYCLENLVKAGEADEKIGIVAPKIYFAPGYEYHYERYQEKEKGKVIWYAGGIIDWNNVLCSHRGVDEVDIGQFDRGLETDFASGCCLLIKRAVLETCGLFDEKYFMYYEDVDYSLRLKFKGWKIWYEPRAVLWHKNAASSGKPGSPLHNYYLTRNRLIFGFKYAKLRTKIALIKNALQIIKRNLPGEKKAVTDFFTIRFGKGR